MQRPFNLKHVLSVILSCSSVLFADTYTLSPEALSFYTRLRSDTLRSLETMRDPSTSLLGDKTTWTEDFKAQSNNGFVASTNIALDLIHLSSIKTSESDAKIATIVGTLSKLEKFKVDASEFFYWAYKKDAEGNLVVENPEVSSIDNFHLAFALWLIANTSEDEKVEETATLIFSKMKLDSFVDSNTGLIRLAYKINSQGQHELMTNSYAFFGSETRSMYALGSALGLVGGASHEKYIQKVVTNLNLECWERPGRAPMLKTWDGGIFQYLLPELLYGESQYSEAMRETFLNLSDYASEEKRNRALRFAPAFSACQQSEPSHEIFKSIEDGAAYAGVSGFYQLMASRNQAGYSQSEVEDVVTPHAAVLLASLEPNRFVSDLRALQQVPSRNGSIYREDQGFMDAYFVEGPLKGVVVPVQLALDQAMIALATDKILDHNQETVSAERVKDYPEVQRKIQDFYKLIDKKVSKQCH